MRISDKQRIRTWDTVIRTKRIHFSEIQILTGRPLFYLAATPADGGGCWVHSACPLGGVVCASASIPSPTDPSAAFVLCLVTHLRFSGPSLSLASLTATQDGYEPRNAEKPHLVPAEPGVAEPRPGRSGPRGAAQPRGDGASLDQHLEYPQLVGKRGAASLAGSG